MIPKSTDGVLYYDVATIVVSHFQFERERRQKTADFVKIYRTYYTKHKIRSTKYRTMIQIL